MNRYPGASRARRAALWIVDRVQSGRDDGFLLLESVIAITIITIVMSAVGVEFLGATAAAGQQRAQQVAVQLADSTVEQIRSLDSSDLVTGRGSVSVASQFAAATATVQPWLANMDQASDPAVDTGSGVAAAVPTSPSTQTPGAVSYGVNQYLGWCSIRSSGSTDCVKTSTLTGVASKRYLRAIVAVTWTGPRCSLTTGATRTCAYVTSTLISATSDPTFRINAAPYAAPIVVARADQTSVVDDEVSLQMYVQNGTGVPTFTWAVSSGALPAGLDLTSNGLISGTVASPAGSYSAFVQVTDAFLRKDIQEVKWTVKPALVLTNPGPRTSIVNRAATKLTLAASGGDGAPFTYSIVGESLPPGLTLATATGVISGTPTTVGPYVVQAKVVDKSTTRSDVVSFTWTIDYTPVVPAIPATKVDTLNTAVTGAQMAATGGSGSYVWSDPSGTLPTGLTISSTGSVTGSPTALTSGSGKAVTLTVADPTAGPSYTKTVSFLWSIVARPTIVAPAASTVTVGQTVNIPSTTVCPNAPCIYTLANGPSGLSVNNAGVIVGTVGVSAPATYSATLTVRDNDGATATSAAFTINVKSGPTVTSPGNRASTVGSSTSVQLTTTCTNTPCTYAFVGTAPTGLGISSTGLISGTVGTPVQTFSGISVVVTDPSGATATTGTFSWTVNNVPTMASPGNQTTQRGASVSLDASTLDARGTGPFTFSASALPSWLTINASTGMITGTAPATNSTSLGITLTVTDASNARATSTAFKWNVTNLANSFGNQTTYRSSAVSKDLDATSTGGTAAFTYTASGLPTWLSLSSATGVISGFSPAVTTNSSTKSAAITITETDSLGATITLAPFFWYNTDIRWSAPATVDTFRGQNMSGTNAYDYVTGGAVTKTYSATGLPTGLTLSSVGAITGSTTTSGVYNVVLTVTDSVGATVSTTLRWTVS